MGVGRFGLTGSFFMQAASLPLPGRLRRLVCALEHGLIERGLALRLALLTALAGEHTLLVGPPGTAKSGLARRLHRAFRDARYFERLLTRFSVPEELFGPLSISALEDDRYERQTAGFLPQAQVAFIDEVFKANSAILNALLTLLNEREFDNGPSRQRCPLISVVGATNEIPADEVGDAFFDRFLVRIPVGPVDDSSFGGLLALRAADFDGSGQAPAEAFDETELHELAAAAAAVELAPDVIELLAELRAWIASSATYVSDRRWVKIAALLRMAAATEGRRAVAVWDLWLLPWCAAPDVARQREIAEWIEARLGTGRALSPPRLSKVVEAFEQQLQIERQGDDLDYDEQGRLRFHTAFEGEVSDAKGGAGALRMSAARRRRYGATHIGARVRQVDSLLARIDGYAGQIASLQDSLRAYAAQAVWMDPGFAGRACVHLDGTAVAIAGLRQRAGEVRAGFESLPRLAPDPGHEPEPIRHETIGPEQVDAS
jgi:MoxR-like ATPase